jgi:hypothetical protein
MPAPAYVLEEALRHYHAIDSPPEPEPRSLSPELILVLPPEEAQAARELLPDREPFDEWLDRLRESEPTTPEPDWEFDQAKARGRVGGVLFATACVVNATLPVVFLLLTR